MARELILIRHAESAPDYEAPADAWGLSQRGRGQAEQLAGSPFWPAVDRLCSSDEPKALATAEPASRAHGLEVRVLRGLREVRRPAGYLPDYDGAVREYLQGGGQALGWESLARAERRIRRCMDALLTCDRASTQAVVSHGTVLALYACRLLGDSDAHRLWKTIPFAGWARIDPDRRVLVQGFAV